MLLIFLAWRCPECSIKHQSVECTNQCQKVVTRRRSSKSSESTKVPSSKKASSLDKSYHKRSHKKYGIANVSFTSIRTKNDDEDCEDLWIPQNDVNSPKLCNTHSRYTSYESRNLQKLKSWDNLLTTTKVYGGYGYGHGYTQVEPAPAKCSSISDRLRSFSSYQLEANNSFSKGSIEERNSKTMPRSKSKQYRRSTENLVTPQSTSSCFSCDCLTADQPSLDEWIFEEPKSNDDALRNVGLRNTHSNVCLVGGNHRDCREKRNRTSLVDCLKGNDISDEVTHL